MRSRHDTRCHTYRVPDLRWTNTSSPALLSLSIAGSLLVLRLPAACTLFPPPPPICYLRYTGCPVVNTFGFLVVGILRRLHVAVLRATACLRAALHNTTLPRGLACRRVYHALRRQNTGGTPRDYGRSAHIIRGLAFTLGTRVPYALLPVTGLWILVLLTHAHAPPPPAALRRTTLRLVRAAAATATLPGEPHPFTNVPGALPTTALLCLYYWFCLLQCYSNATILPACPLNTTLARKA